MTGKVGIVGAGTMGAGIAQVALEAGHEVALFDVVDGAVERAVSRIEDGLGRRAAKRGLTGRDAGDWVAGHLRRLGRPHDLESVARGAVLVVEAVVEEMSRKRAVFAVLDRAAPAGSMLATNTSALPIAGIAAGLRRPERVLGLHFFNPAPVMPLVEVVVTAATSPEIADGAERLMRLWGKTPVRCSDVPGFIVNRVNRPFTLEPLRMLEAGEASVAEIDAAVRDAGFPQGPFEHIDLVGLDVNLASSRAIHDALGRPDRLAPSTLQARLVGDGHLGRKRGLGFYEYDARGHPVGPAPGFGARAGGCAAAGRAATAPLPAEAIVARIRLALANEAFFAMGEGVADAAEIDLALRLGAAHPQGPVEWARGRGPERVARELEGLRASLGDRWDLAPLLREEARPGRQAVSRSGDLATPA